MACSNSGHLIAASMDNVINIWSISNGLVFIDTYPQPITALAWPEAESDEDGKVEEVVLIGRSDGVVIELKVYE